VIRTDADATNKPQTAGRGAGAQRDCRLLAALDAFDAKLCALAARRQPLREPPERGGGGARVLLGLAQRHGTEQARDARVGHECLHGYRTSRAARERRVAGPRRARAGAGSAGRVCDGGQEAVAVRMRQSVIGCGTRMRQSVIGCGTRISLSVIEVVGGDEADNVRALAARLARAR